jgi:low molecular weight phosphotyrosine protein phosphatase
MREKGVEMNHIARQITKEDYLNYDFIFGMDEDNLENLRRKKPTDAHCVIDFLGTYDPQGEKIIHDPYTGDMEDFVHVYKQCVTACQAFLEKQS